MKKEVSPIKERIAHYRKLAGYTQKTAAQALGLNERTYSYRERSGNPKHDFLKQIAALYNVDFNTLIMGEKSNYDPFKNGDFTIEPKPPTQLHEPKTALFSPAPFVLTATERSIIGGMRDLSKTQCEEVMALINKLRNENKANKKG